jgi:hypothetical protein
MTLPDSLFDLSHDRQSGLALGLVQLVGFRGVAPVWHKRHSSATLLDITTPLGL